MERLRKRISLIIPLRICKFNSYKHYSMHNILLIKAFEKARGNTGSDKLTRWSNCLSDFIYEDSGEVYGERSLRVNYNLVYKDKDKQIDLRSYVVDSLCHYLGYKNYNDFITENPSTEIEVKRKNRKLIIKIVITFLIVIFASALSYVLYNSTLFGQNFGKCMVWKENHYERRNCSGEDLEEHLDRIVLKEFRKVEVCDTTRFFKNGKAIIWYDKSNNKMSYFTHTGIHPTNGKTLKPITRTIIKAHVKPCDSVKKYVLIAHFLFNKVSHSSINSVN